MYTPGYFKDRKITVMGLGLLGRGVGDAKFFAEEGAHVIVTDLKPAEDLKTSVDALASFPNVTFALGGHRLDDFRGRDLVLKAAGVPLDSPFIAEARKSGVPVEMSTALFAALTPATVVGITGTRGKSTTTSLIHHILKRRGMRSYLGGNVRGVSTLPLVRELKEGDIAVLELDSWQLQGFGERRMSPHVSVFTNIMPDHQNYYKNDMEAYFADKANIYTYQKEGDTLVVGSELYESRRSDFQEHKGELVVANADGLPELLPSTLLGAHNRSNLACALAAVGALGIPQRQALEAIDDFAGLEGRLELVRNVRGAGIYNDTNSTTPDATLAGLQALAKERNVVLIMGGADKNLSMGRLVRALDRYCKAVVLLPGTGTSRLGEYGIGSVSTQVTEATTLAEAVSAALSKAEAGDVVLFSPGFASFGLFKNEYDRGDQFKAIVGSLQE